MSESGNVFHITVGTSPSGSVDLRPELRLLKAALLYADKVKFCSISSTFILKLILGTGNIAEEDLWDLLLTIDQYRAVKPVVDRYRTLQQKKHLQGAEVREFRQHRRHLNKIFETAKPLIEASVEKLTNDAGVDGLISAINSGLVEIQDFTNADIKEWVTEFFDVVGNAVLAKETYPLFDGGTGELINYAFREGKLNPSDLSKNKSKQAGLASDLLHRLPLFDNASIDVIVDIRRELDKPLTRFRAAIMKFSDEVENEAWKEEFPKECEQVFRQYVEPSILEIEDAYKSIPSIMALLPRLLTSQKTIASSITMLIANASHLPEILTLGLGLAGPVSETYDFLRERKQQVRGIEQNQLYFYYKADEMLSETI